jgi:hypothetical protein
MNGCFDFEVCMVVVSRIQGLDYFTRSDVGTTSSNNFLQLGQSDFCNLKKRETLFQRLCSSRPKSFDILFLPKQVENTCNLHYEPYLLL